MRVALDAGRRAGEQDRAAALAKHAPRRLLRDQEAAERGDHEGLPHLGRVEIDQSAVGALARVVVHDLERAELRVDLREQPFDLVRLGGVAAQRQAADLVRQRRELVRIARGEPHLEAFARQHPGERGADAVPGADDQCGLGHAFAPSSQRWSVASNR